MLINFLCLLHADSLETNQWCVIVASSCMARSIPNHGVSSKRKEIINSLVTTVKVCTPFSMFVHHYSCPSSLTRMIYINHYWLLLIEEIIGGPRPFIIIISAAVGRFLLSKISTLFIPLPSCVEHFPTSANTVRCWTSDVLSISSQSLL